MSEKTIFLLVAHKNIKIKKKQDRKFLYYYLIFDKVNSARATTVDYIANKHAVCRYSFVQIYF